MTNPYYSHASGLPISQTRALATQVAGELDAVAAGFALLPTPAQLAGGSSNYAVDTGAANALVIAIPSAITALTDGLAFSVNAAANNTGATTIAVGSLGSPAIVRVDGSALQVGDILAGQIILIAYSAAVAKFQLLASGAGVAQAAAAASATAAAASAAAATNAANVYGTSISSVAIPTDTTGSASFTYVEANRAIAVGMYIIAADTAAPATNTVTLQVTAWNSSTQVVTGKVVAFQGGGTKTAWTLSLTGAPGNAFLDRVYTIVSAGVTLANLASSVPSGRQALVVIPSNLASAPTSFSTSDGWSLAVGGAGSYATTYAGTAHGVWGNLVATPAGSAITMPAVATLKATVKLSASLAVAFFSAGSSGMYAAALDLVNNVAGNAISLGGGGSGGSLYAYGIDAATFVCGFSVGSGATAHARAGSISGTTVTLGPLADFPALASGTAVIEEFIQLSASQYVARIDSSGGGTLTAMSVATTTVSMGSSVAVGGADDTQPHNARILPIDAADFLLAYNAAGGGTSSTRLFSARVGSIAANTITLNAAADTASNTQTDNGFVVAAKLGPSYIVVASKGNGTTSADVRSITVSGTTPTIGAASNQTAEAFATPTATLLGTFFNRPAARWMVSGSVLLGTNPTAGSCFAIDSTGAVGSTFTPTSNTSLQLLSSADSLSAYAVGTRFDRLSISGTTLTSAEQVVLSSVVSAPTDTLNNKGVKYAGTWYSWVLATPSAGGVLSASQAIFGGSSAGQFYRYNIT